MLTNFRTIRRRIDRMEQINKMREDGTFDMLPKKEVAKLELEPERYSCFCSRKFSAYVNGSLLLPMKLAFSSELPSDSPEYLDCILWICSFVTPFFINSTKKWNQMK